MMCESECVKSKLSPCALGFAFGIVKGVWLLGLAWVAAYFGYGVAMVEHIGTFHHGYTASLSGGLMGGLAGFICGFISGVILGWLYNFFLCCCCKKQCSTDDVKK